MIDFDVGHVEKPDVAALAYSLCMIEYYSEHKAKPEDIEWMKSFEGQSTSINKVFDSEENARNICHVDDLDADCEDCPNSGITNRMEIEACCSYVINKLEQHGFTF